LAKHRVSGMESTWKIIMDFRMAIFAASSRGARPPSGAVG
jgi:hypothetical protein